MTCAVEECEEPGEESVKVSFGGHMAMGEFNYLVRSDVALHICATHAPIIRGDKFTFQSLRIERAELQGVTIHPPVS